MTTFLVLAARYATVVLKVSAQLTQSASVGTSGLVGAPERQGLRGDEDLTQQIDEAAYQRQHCRYEECRDDLRQRQLKGVADEQCGNHDAHQQSTRRAQCDGAIDEMSALHKPVEFGIELHLFVRADIGKT